MPHDLKSAAQRETVMDVTAEQIARVYAQAYVGAAQSSGQPEELIEELESLVADVIVPHRSLEFALTSSLLSQDEKAQMLDRVFGGRASQLLLNFLKVLSRHGRLGLLRSIARSVRKIYATSHGRCDVEVTTASPLDDELTAALMARLQQKLGCQPVLSLSVDPSLLAGWIVKVGDTVYDSSVRTLLHRTHQAMIARTVETIDTEPEKFILDTA